MKRTERHHLKENELVNLAQRSRDALEARRSQTLAIVGALAVVLVGVLAYWAWQGRVESRSGALLADAMTIDLARVGPPPAPGTPAVGLSFPTEREKQQAALEKYKAAADQYPSTDAGVFARYRVGAISLALGNPADAIAAYQDVIDRSASSLYGQMARLGVAEARARAGEFDSAIATFNELSQQKDGPLPVDGVLMQLGRTYLEAGKPAEAQQTFSRLVEEYPNSPYTGEAQRELETLKKT
jgi:TolA-binding protein